MRRLTKARTIQALALVGVVLVVLSEIYVSFHAEGFYREMDSRRATPPFRANNNGRSNAAGSHCQNVSTSTESLTIDIISTGTIHKPDLQATQRDIFASFRQVRTLYAITEWDDHDADCHKRLNETQVKDVIRYCQNYQENEAIFKRPKIIKFKKLLHNHSAHPGGWVCAQQRPLSGFHRALQDYRTCTSLPDYLVILDDDTFLNIPALTKRLLEAFPSDDTHILTGCLMGVNSHESFAFPFGGMATILSRRVIENIMRPLDCVKDKSIFVQLSCQQIRRNWVGEQGWFRNGMSLGDLMYAHMTRNKYTQVDQWTGSGFCFHSDHVWAYWLGTGYPVSKLVNNGTESARRFAVLSSKYPRWGECDWSGERCRDDSLVCHRMTARLMKERHAAHQRP